MISFVFVWEWLTASLTGDSDDVRTDDGDELTGDTDELFLVPARGSKYSDSGGGVDVLK